MMRFVTAIYSKLYGTSFGGRLNRDRHYLYSLKNLLSMGNYFICYTSSDEIVELEKYFNDYTNIEFRIYNLDSSKHHKRIQEIKELNKERYSKDDVWTYRCVELMWLKVRWLYQEAIDQQSRNKIRKMYDASLIDEKICWIDAGLSHGGIIPIKYNKNNNINLITYENSFENNLAFNDKFVNKIDQLSQDKLFAFYCNNRQHQYPELFINDNTLSGSIVAGVFGGNADVILEIYKQFEIVIDDILNANDLIQEEMALTRIYQKFPELFSVYDFDTWYHIDWDCFDTNQKSFSEFFEDLHERI